ncbi:ribonucleoside-diphosphate reductase subunit alpha [Spirochaeta cellobiosiphila]|uniref:ribonucleoside-diphosphate reductase subunit alpha n=1 Tax=Spirochaeta cellobiosiphila TaxID=504483 RepID=UPI00041993A9|nr:ribonucleoside-diphosphate reductase subunit alpha [Spirochaeta cellobiosiphila]
MQVIKRDGSHVDFNKDRIHSAISKAFEAQNLNILDTVLDALVDSIVEKLESVQNSTLTIESIQDCVELSLAEAGYFQVARAYILYREEHRKHREDRLEQMRKQALQGNLEVTKSSGDRVPFSTDKIVSTLERVTTGYSRDIDIPLVFQDIIRNIYPGITTKLLEKAAIQSLSNYIERDPSYERAAARLFLQKIYKEITQTSDRNHQGQHELRNSFINNIKEAVELNHFDKRLLGFDLELLSTHLDYQRDQLLQFRSLETLTERYFYQRDKELKETPQSFWMRVAMGLAIEEQNKNERAIEFYHVLSQLYFIPSTPTLFHSGTDLPQLSSCYLSTVPDDLQMIFKVLGDNAQLAKWSGGIGNDWTPVRATGAMIKSTRVESQGVIPFLKIANDTTFAINRSGKRRGAACAYLETWHLDIEDFLDLRRNTGDERRRTHDMNTANWIPDLFMERVKNKGTWTLFSPSEVPDLHDLYGRAFKDRYEYYEGLAKEGKIAQYREIEAEKLWRKMLTRLFETGHPWITFKDPSNIRSPQDHVGVVHNSNLCTEITLNNSADETAVCNLGSINMRNMVTRHGIIMTRLQATIRTAMRMLDNVIDLNFYPTEEAKNSNMRHRPVGLGMMGLQDALFIQRIPFDSKEALEFTDRFTEAFSYYALEGSSDLAKERGSYSSFKGSKWDRGLLPIDTLDLLEAQRGLTVDVDRSQTFEWNELRDKIKEQGMRNSNTMALAPTATISNIAGSFPTIEPIYKNIYVKSNMSGEFTILNTYMVEDLKNQGLWSKDMLDKIKYFDGNLDGIPEIPAEYKQLYKEAFEISPIQMIEMAARRAKWIDQSQSHNVFMKGASGKMLDQIYMTAWEKGLKSTYYLRTLAASQIEKSTLDAKTYGFTQKREYTQPASVVGNICSLTDPECESCQ